MAAALIVLLKRRKETFGELQMQPQIEKTKSEGKPCFIEELMQSKHLSELNRRQLKVCPISQQKSTSCHEPLLIIQTYQSICDDIDDQLVDFNWHYSESQQVLSQSEKRQTFRESQAQMVFVGQRQWHCFEMSQEWSMEMASGANNVFIQIIDQDVGSIVAYGLQSNMYFEALLREDYMGLKSLLSSSAGELVSLVGSDDVFNCEQPNQKKLERALLDPSSPSLKLKFSVQSHSYTTKSGQSRQTSQAKHKFCTGKSK